MELHNLCQFVGILVKRGETENNLHMIFLHPVECFSPPW